MDNANWWFYTLSAGAQVFAALIAVSAAAVIFKMNTIEKDMLDFRMRLIKLIIVPLKGGNDALYAVYSDVKINDISFNELQRYLSDKTNEEENIHIKVSFENFFQNKHTSSIKDTLSDNYRAFFSLFTNKKTIKKNFNYSFTLLIIGALINLIFLIYNPNQILVGLIMAASVILGGFGLCFTYRTIMLQIYSD